MKTGCNYLTLAGQMFVSDWHPLSGWTYFEDDIFIMDFCFINPFNHSPFLSGLFGCFSSGATNDFQLKRLDRRKTSSLRCKVGG